MYDSCDIVKRTVAVHEDERNAVIFKIHAVTASRLYGTGQKIRISVIGKNIKETGCSTEHVPEELACCLFICILAYDRCRITLREKARKIMEHELVDA